MTCIDLPRCYADVILIYVFFVVMWGCAVSSWLTWWYIIDSKTALDTAANGEYVVVVANVSNIFVE